MTDKQVNMKIFMPIDIESSVKKSAEETSEGNWYVRGYASTPDLDYQGEIVKPMGIDIHSYFLKSGYINYDHQKSPDDIIGEPTANCYVDSNGLFVEAMLYKNSPKARSIWTLANTLKESNSSRRIGFSIEGKITKRDMSQKNIIDEVMITNVAITTHPANPNATWEALVKSFTTGHDVNPETVSNGSALRNENISNAIVNLAENLDLGDREQWYKIEEIVKSKSDNMNTNILLLQLANGLSREQAMDYLDSLATKGDNQ